MSPSSPRLPRPSTPDGLPELLARLPRWDIDAAIPASVEVDGTYYRVSCVRRGTGVGALVCEAPLGAPFPSCPTRRSIRLQLCAPDRWGLIVFTDAARSAEVWSWATRDPGGPLVNHERVIWPNRGDGALRATLVEVAGAKRPGVDVRALPAPTAPSATVPPILLRAAGRRFPGLLRTGGPVWRLRSALPPEREPDLLQLLQDLVEHPSDPSIVRAVWRAVASVRVFDPMCGAGDWLVEVMDLLESVYIGCLERMQLWLDGTLLERRPRRVDYLRDFRAVLARAGDTRRYPSFRAFAAEAIVLYNLFGADTDGRKVASCRRRLLSRLGTRGRGGSPAIPSSVCNVRVGDPRHGLASRRAVAHALAGLDAAEATLLRLTEEAEVAGRADRLLRTLRLEHGTHRAAMEAGALAIRQRIDAASRELDGIALHAAGVDPADRRAGARWLREHRPLHLFSEWHWVVRHGGFHLVRG